MRKRRIVAWLASGTLAVGIIGTSEGVANAATSTHAQRAAKAVSAAKSVIGCPYVWGGNGPCAFDCSGLTHWAWAKAGDVIPRTAAAQYAGEPRVAWANRQAGDLIAYGNPVHHITMYIGNSQMIAAPHTGTNVQIQNVYWTDYRGMVRPP